MCNVHRTDSICIICILRNATESSLFKQARRMFTAAAAVNCDPFQTKTVDTSIFCPNEYFSYNENERFASFIGVLWIKGAKIIRKMKRSIFNVNFHPTVKNIQMETSFPSAF